MSEIPSLLHQCGSPLYVYDLNQIEAAYSQFRQAFSYPETEIHYALVCNHNHHIVRTLSAAGAGIHANTPGDAHAARWAGVPAAHIMYSGSNLNTADFDYLLSQDIALNLDSLDQVHDLLAQPSLPTEIGLRYLIDAPESSNRIGISAEDLPLALELLKGSGIRLSGLHMYAGTNNLNPQRFLDCFERLLEASQHLPDLGYLNLGGGFGIPYQPGQQALPLQEMGAYLSERMQALSQARGYPVRLILEPGRWLVAAAGILYMTVVSVKIRGGRRFVGVDSSIANIVVPSVYHPYHAFSALKPRGPELDLPTDICGCSTHSRDFLGRGLSLPDLQPGDILAMHDVGAYGYAMSSHFLNRPRPAEVVCKNGDYLLSRRREVLDDLLALQLEQAVPR